MNEIINIQGIECYEKDGTAYLKLDTVARGLGFTQIAASGNEVVRWERVRKYLSEFGIPTCGDADFIPENVFYPLGNRISIFRRYWFPQQAGERRFYSGKCILPLGYESQK